MKVKFSDGPSAVTLDGVGRVERGKAVEVSEEIGEQLVEQGWTRVGTSRKSTSKRRKSTSKTESATATAGGDKAPDGGLSKESTDA